MRKIKVIWTVEEVETLSKQVLNYQKDHPRDRRNIVSIVRDCQEVLGKDRCKYITTINNIRSVLDCMEDMLKAEANIKLEEPTKEVKEVVKEITREYDIKQEPTGILLEELLIRLFDVQSIKVRLDTIEQLLSQKFQLSQPHFPYPSSPELLQQITPRKIKKPVMLIIGLLPGQHQYFTQRLGNSVIFKFMESCDKGKVPPDADYVYCMAKFVSHAICRRVESLLGKRIYNHHGGLLELCNLIEKDLRVVT